MVDMGRISVLILQFEIYLACDMHLKRQVLYWTLELNLIEYFLH